MWMPVYRYRPSHVLLLVLMWCRALALGATEKEHLSRLLRQQASSANGLSIAWDFRVRLVPMLWLLFRHGFPAWQAAELGCRHWPRGSRKWGVQGP